MQSRTVCGHLAHRQRLAHQQMRMQCAVGDGVGHFEAPISGVRLHDFKAAGHPLDSLKQALRIQLCGWCAAHAKHQLRF